MITPRRCCLALAVAAAALAGCPQERPGSAKEIPQQRIPPAMPVEAAPPSFSPDGGSIPGSAAQALPAATPPAPAPARRR